MKKFLCALLSLAMLLSLVACGNTSQDQSSESNTEDSSGFFAEDVIFP